MGLTVGHTRLGVEHLPIDQPKLGAKRARWQGQCRLEGDAHGVQVHAHRSAAVPEIAQWEGRQGLASRAAGATAPAKRWRGACGSGWQREWHSAGKGCA